MFLSEWNSVRIDELRCEAIKKQLGRFSVVLEKRHMMRLDENGEDIGLADTESLSDHGSCLEGDDEIQNALGGNGNIDDADCINSGLNDEAGSEKEEHCAISDVKIDIDSAKDEEAQSQKEEGDVKIEITVPAGQLGIELTREATGVTEVLSVREDSPLSGKIKVGDKIILIGNVDVELFPYEPKKIIMFLDAANSAIAQSKITILRRANSSCDESTDVGMQNPEGSASNDYTHVQIPYPGYDLDSLEVKKTPIPTEENNASKWRLLYARDNSQTNNQQLTQKEEADAGDNNDAKAKRNGEQRNVPHFCAICLGEFDISETISWASNSDCTHVFHQECIIQWLSTLGKKISKYQRFSDDPSVLQLLNYKLECPSCRQDFISKLALDDDECRGENNV